MTTTTKTTWNLFFTMTILVLTLLMSAVAPNRDTHLFRQSTNAAKNNGGKGTGKTPATPGAQPWMVGLIDAGEKNAKEGHFCGASLIAPDLVLTAAHCVEESGSPDEIDIVTGRHVLSSNAGDRVNVDQVFLHSGYFDNEDGEDNDIAILKLDRPVKVGTPIKLIGAANAYVDDAGVMARVTGWGVMSENGEDSPDELHGVDLPVVSQQACRTAYGADLLPDGICAGFAEGGKDSCYGDSGGPLVARDRTGTPVQIGVVSWGEVCGENYGIYARVTEYENWVRDIRNGDIEPTDMAAIAEMSGGEDDGWDDDGWDDASEDDGWWLEDEGSDAGDWETGEGLVEVDGAVLPSSYELTNNDLFDSEQSVTWEAGNGKLVDLYASDDGTASLDELIEGFGGHDGRIVTIKGTKVLLEQLQEEDGSFINSAAYVIDGVTVEIYGQLSDAQLTTMIASLL